MDTRTIGTVFRTVYDAWQQNKHPRGKGGKFTKKGSAVGEVSASAGVEGSAENADIAKRGAPSDKPYKTHPNYRKQYPNCNERMSQETKNYADAAKPHMHSANHQDFAKAIAQARQNSDQRKKWRVDASGPQHYDETDAKCFMSESGACVAVTGKHDIISVCAPPGGDVNGKQIMAWAVAQGGDRLDTYEGNIGFYMKCGFQPVAACKFDSQFVIENGWDPELDTAQDIVFMKYTGRSRDQIFADYGDNGCDYKGKIKMFDGEQGYANAQEYRDGNMD